MPSQSFGILLKYRLAAGLTQEELAEHAGISTRGISDLERGVRRTSYKGTVEMLADALQLSGSEREVFKNAARRNTNQPLPAAPLPTISSLPPLVGRSGELKLIARYLAEAEPPVLMLTGEPGIGKTRLLNEIAARSVAQGWTVLEGSCTRRGGQSPYAPVLEALAERLNRQSRDQQQIELKDCEWLVRLLPELSQLITPPILQWQLSPEQERRLVFAAVGRYLANIAGTSGSIEHFQTAFSKAVPSHLTELVSGLELYGLIHYWVGRPTEATTISRQALELARQTYDTTSIARALANLGLALGSEGRYAEAFKVFAEARQFAQEQAMGQGLARAISMWGGTSLEIFNYARAEALALEARQISQNLQWPLADTSSGIDLLFNFVRTGRLEKALALIEEVGKAVEAGQGSHGWLWRLRYATAQGELALTQQQYKAALNKAEQVIEQSRLSKRVKYQALGLEIRGKALAALNQLDKAKADLESAVSLARSIYNPALLLRAELAYLSLFKSDMLLLEARSLVRDIADNLGEQEQIECFLASSELGSI